MAITYRNICFDALGELQMYQAGDVPAPEDLDFTQQKLVRLLDNWNADDRAVYAEVFDTFTLVPSLSPHTIGPSGATWTLSQRPESIEGMSLILPATPNNVNIPIIVRDYQWWMAQSVQALTTNYPTDCYYETDWPNGKLFFWPIPQAAYDVQLTRRTVLDSAFSISASFSLPPGYRDAITLTLAEDLVSSFGAAARPAPLLPQKAREARARVFGANAMVPRIATADYGMPTGAESATMTTFNYYSRTWNR